MENETTQESGLTSRMEAAMELADKCWGKANKLEPKFVETYMALAEELLSSKPAVTGDEFRDYCANHRLFRPATLHPNVWVSGVKALHSMGWITRIQKVEPVKAHNHMPSVTLWRSEIFHGLK